MSKKITIFHLYPDAMNLYGDLGNIITLKKRAEWRGIEVEIKNVHVGDKVNFSHADILFMGGGQDSGQKVIIEDLLSRGQDIKDEITSGLPALLICGGFQLFGKYFLTSTNEKLQGIEVFKAYTLAGEKRLIGNVVADVSHALTTWQSENPNMPNYFTHNTIVGFENHSGQTILESGCKPFGNIIKGFGNQGNGGYEGAIYKNAIGTYLHGSLLPKNPGIADFLITMAIYRRYGVFETLTPLDDSIENRAHEAAIQRAGTAKTVSI